ncbi:PhoX family phosphatase [Nitrobacter sp.]|uniref:PhoX family protein n=1 Tax=Nitrobacter sp. TaxID=29420 RepID=UPI001E01F7E5|nr:PhoX family phosphatase [Nitrobacter sp.]MCB1393193.1 PhoX family phosphatase [Nitrobacter sp.]
MSQAIEIIPGDGCDEPPCLETGNPRFGDLVTRRLKRRDVLVGGLASALVALFVRPSGGRAGNRLDFKPVPVSRADCVAVPEGYRVQVLLPWGEPILGRMPAFTINNSGEDQAMQIGSHHDGMHFFAIDGSSDDGLLVVNHEYVEPRLMQASASGLRLGVDDAYLIDGRRPADDVLKEMNAHGVSVVRIHREADGGWAAVADPRNRRITALTPMELAGPARGSDFVKTKYSPDGTSVRGTLSNCASGATPWNTYLAAEENWALYFRNDDSKDGKPDQPREHSQYRVPRGKTRYHWELADNGDDAFVRFDASRKAPSPTEDYRNEPNAFGWMVEIDPFQPDAVPVKRTALGRFAHEGVVFAPPTEGRPLVCYSGDDAKFQFIYKFVSAQPYSKANAGGHLLNDGTLYAARFNDDGTGDWLALAIGQNGLTSKNGFCSQAEVLVNTRAAAKHVGATRMDRPESGAIEPTTGAVYFSLTSNIKRKPDEVDKANPRAENYFGHIVRWTEEGNDHTATRFRWQLFVIGGDQASGRDLTGRPLNENNLFACPDGLWFDADGRLWIQTDISDSFLNKGRYEPFGNNAMLCADPQTGEIRRFLTGPLGQEITGVTTTPDGRTMFVNVQHPGAHTSADEFAHGGPGSHWPAGGSTVPRSATLVITREDGDIVGV